MTGIAWDVTVISNSDLLEYCKGGLDQAGALLAKQDKSPFQEHLLETLLLYSKSSISNDLSDRLVFILVALEYLLLKNKSEAITRNFARRFSVLLGENDERRAELEQRVRDIYKSRSNFIHHAEKVRDMELLTNFMRDAWCLMMRVLLELSDRYQTKADFISSIDQASPQKEG